MEQEQITIEINGVEIYATVVFDCTPATPMLHGHINRPHLAATYDLKALLIEQDDGSKCDASFLIPEIEESLIRDIKLERGDHD